MILLNKLFSAKKSAKGRVDYPLLLVGAVIYGISVGLVLSPNEIAPGGASGLAVMLSRFLPLGVGSLTMAINLPLLAVSLYVFGWHFLLGTVVAIAVSGLTADMCTLFTPLTNDIFLSAIAGGILLGAGCGIVFRSGGTTGGTDIAAKLIKRKKPYMAAGQIFMLADGVICVLSGFVFGSIDNALYSFFTLWVFSKTLDMILYGGDRGKLALIISPAADKILHRLLNEGNLGCTVIKARTGYTGEDRDLILCAVRKRRITDVRRIASETDEKAFVLVGDVSEIIGEGFRLSDDYF